VKPETLAQARLSDLKAARVRELETNLSTIRLLAEKNHKLMASLHEKHDMSFSELGLIFGLTRQAVHLRYLQHTVKI
jgi:predicted DNA-binding protein YlxM (UPF0122 family)